jgi:hypothetical protein
LGHRDDVLLLPQLPRAAHVQRLYAAGIEPMEWVTDLARLSERKVGHLKPWAWSPPLIESLAGVAARDALPDPSRLGPLFSKAGGTALLRALGGDDVGLVCATVAEAREAIGHWLCRGHTMVVAKAPWGLAGRGQRRLSAMDEAWVSRMIEKQGAVIIEPWLDRVADFSAQYDISATGEARLAGMVQLHCDDSGRFLACRAGRSFSRLFAGECARALHDFNAEAFYAKDVPHALAPWLAGSGFHGYLGIDALIHRTPAGTLKIRSVVEVNPRCTMGRITHALRRYVAPESRVTLRIRPHTTPEAIEAQCQQNPLILAEGRWVSGVLPLNDPLTAQRFIAMVEVAAHGDSKNGAIKRLQPPSPERR